MTEKKRIIKVGFCLIRDHHVLLARSHGDAHFQIPGGKPEAGETDIDALAREVKEELAVDLDPATATHIETFEAAAAGRPGIVVEVRLYGGSIAGVPQASNEIAALHWQSLTGACVPCSDVVRVGILPFLAKGHRAP